MLRNAAGQTALVFDPSNILTSKVIIPLSTISEAQTVPADLFAQNGAVWTASGLSRQFNGVTHADTTVKRSLGDLVNGVNGNAKVTQSLSVLNPQSADLVAESPSSVVFLVDDPTGTPKKRSLV